MMALLKLGYKSKTKDTIQETRHLTYERGNVNSWADEDGKFLNNKVPEAAREQLVLSPHRTLGSKVEDLEEKNRTDF